MTTISEFDEDAAVPDAEVTLPPPSAGGCDVRVSMYVGKMCLLPAASWVGVSGSGVPWPAAAVVR
jgi:hypothetical protein